MRIATAAVLMTVCCGLPWSRAAAEVFPPSPGLSCTYVLSGSHVAVSDTFSITRTITNGESFALSGLFFSDNLPPEFVLVDHIVRINGEAVPFLVTGPVAGLVDPFHDAYYWIVDSQGEHPGIDTIVGPGEVVVLQIDLVCDEPGQYNLPIHTAVFTGNGLGFFATSDSAQVVVGSVAAVDDVPPHGAARRTLMTTAHPNPFNPLVTIHYSGRDIAGKTLVFSVFNLSGKKIEQIELVAEGDAGILSWRPDASVSSGVYLYRIADRNRSAGGKLVLLK